jgi:hypothetical protein
MGQGTVSKVSFLESVSLLRILGFSGIWNDGVECLGLFELCHCRDLAFAGPLDPAPWLHRKTLGRLSSRLLSGS